MNYRIEKKEAFRIVGISCPLDHDLEKNFAAVPGLWRSAAEQGTLQKLAGMMDSEPMGVLGVSACGTEEDWIYYIAVASTQTNDALEEYTVPAFTWAVFSGEGTCPQAIQELEQRIVTEWLPDSGYEYANGPDVERYLNTDMQNSRFEVWIPVVRK